jgi:glutamate synthase (NADPH/NADH) small chain
MSLKDLITPFYVWQRAFEKPYTQRRPIEERPGAPRYRGFHDNDMDKCVGCGTCEAICQNHAIDMVRVEGYQPKPGDSGLRPRFDYGRCCWCALCVDICTTRSLRLSNHYAWLTEDPDAFRFVAGADPMSWNQSELGYRRDDAYQLLTLDRIDMEMLDPEQSRSSFDEVAKGYTPEQAVLEADRCVECGICVATCPAHMAIPDYIKAVREGDLEKGLQLLYETNPFSATCGRICTHRCETVCVLGHEGEPIAIRWLKRAIIDRVDRKDFHRILGDEPQDNGKRVAVVGAGPGGLSTAYYLRRKGYAITVFEAKHRAGGMLRYGVPVYRLPDDQLDKDIEYIRSLGVDIQFSTRVGTDVSFSSLVDGYDAVFIATGLFVPYQMRIKGEEHPRVLSGLKVLDDVAEGRDPGVGKRVAVIGGGNVAMDAARVSRRYGAEVTILYRRRVQDMPADPEEIHESQAEGCRLITQAIPVEIHEGAHPDEVVIKWGEAEMVADESGGRPRPVLQEDRMHTQAFDCIIAAIGQGADFSFIPEEYRDRIRINRGKIAFSDYQQTSMPKIFVGGDIANNTADAISAIEDGHHAARGIDRMLSGQPVAQA